MQVGRAPISGILDDLESAGNGNTVSAGDVVATFQHRSLGVIMTVFALVAAMPIIGGIPGVSIVTGTLILVAISQSLIGVASSGCRK